MVPEADAPLFFGALFFFEMMVGSFWDAAAPSRWYLGVWLASAAVGISLARRTVGGSLPVLQRRLAIALVLYEGASAWPG